MNKWKISLFFITLFIWCIVIVLPAHPDYDLWARLLAGQNIIENGKIFMQDIYSYTPTNNIWFDHEWGASAVFYWITTLSSFFHKTKFEMLILFQQILIFSITCLSILCIKIRRPNFSTPYQILYFTLVVLCSQIAYTPTVRCHMFTFLFFTLFLLILESYRIYNKKYLTYLLPVIMLIWANTHGGCLSGLGILIIYTIGEFLNKKEWKPLFSILLISLATLFINPYGTDYVKFLFTAGTMNRSMISEWQSPFLMTGKTMKFILWFIFMSGIFISQIILKRNELKQYDKTKILLLVATGTISLLHAKLLPFFMITSSIFLFDDVFEIINKNSFLKKIGKMTNVTAYILIWLLSAVVLNINQAVPVNTVQYPYQAVEFIKKQKLSGNLFTDMTYGSFCAYKLYPQNKIFMDGRYEEVYNTKLLHVMKNFLRQEGENPMSVINDYPTDILLLFSYNKPYPVKSIPLVEKMQKLGWKLIYKDGSWFIMVSPKYNKPLYDDFSKDSKKPFQIDKYEYYAKNLL